MQAVSRSALALLAVLAAAPACAVPSAVLSPLSGGDGVSSTGGLGSGPDPRFLQPMTLDDLRAMAELDGDPSTLLPDEAEMLDLLRQLLLASPLEQQQP